MIQRRDMLLALNGAAKQASPMLPYGQFIPMDNDRRLRIVKVPEGGYMLVINRQMSDVEEVSFLITRQELVRLTTSRENPFDQLTEILVAIRKYGTEPG